ncbi:MAG: hypothetical protein HQ596_01610 [Candidatus Saganbacteria bacterium]|nr:hypothetical protein [Candidatus Saganbacteria bacterium]
MDLTNFINSLDLTWMAIWPPIINMIAALFLLLIGLLIARGLGNLTTMVLKVIQLDKGAEQVGFKTILEKGGLKKSASELVGSFIYWVIAFLVIFGVTGAFGLPIGLALLRFFAYMGIVLLAALILGVGVFMAGVISGIVKIIMANLGIEASGIVSRVIFYVIIIFAFLGALAELGFSPDWTPHIGIILGMPALAIAIAFGLGCKDMAADFLSRLFKGK